MSISRLNIVIVSFFMLTSCGLSSEEPSEDLSKTEPKDLKLERLEGREYTERENALVSFKNIQFTLDNKWEVAFSNQNEIGYKITPCDAGYCDNFGLSFTDTKGALDYLDWDELVSQFVTELVDNGASDLTLLRDDFNNADSTYYELRFSTKNKGGESLISELHCIWLKDGVYSFYFTAKDLPQGSFTEFKISAIVPLMESVIW